MDYSKIITLNIFSGIVSLSELDIILQVTLLVVSIILTLGKLLEISIDNYKKIKGINKDKTQEPNE